MDYDLSRLSTRSFEQLVQALALTAIGPGVVVFGDGPDGAREATHTGKMAYPDSAAGWDGYLVVQAKFRQRSNSTKDADWALNELKAEFEKFKSIKRKLKKPQYYIFATNVVLSAVDKLGGKDKVSEYLKSQKAANGLEDFRIWDYDQIRAFLDGNRDVRTAYSAWITSGDVLEAVLNHLSFQRPDFGATLQNYLQKELRAEQYAKLAGC